jgi:hypothetical protein
VVNSAIPTISALLGGQQWPSVPSPIAPADVQAHTTGPATTRPLYGGEYVTHPNGDWSTEITSSSTGDDGTTRVVPTLWLVNGVPYVLPPDLAQQFATQSGLPFPKFGTVAGSEAYTNNREAGEQDMQRTAWRPMFSPIDQAIFSQRQGQRGSLISQLLQGRNKP